MLSRRRVRAKALEVRDQLPALAEHASLGEDPGAHAPLDAFHERRVLAADLTVEGKQLVDPALREDPLALALQDREIGVPGPRK
jgi:hypothetical protein